MAIKPPRESSVVEPPRESSVVDFVAGKVESKDGWSFARWLRWKPRAATEVGEVAEFFRSREDLREKILHTNDLVEIAAVLNRAGLPRDLRSKVKVVQRRWRKWRNLGGDETEYGL